MEKAVLMKRSFRWLFFQFPFKQLIIHTYLINNSLANSPFFSILHFEFSIITFHPQCIV